jgi:hypothetical protein
MIENKKRGELETGERRREKVRRWEGEKVRR